MRLLHTLCLLAAGSIFSFPSLSSSYAEDKCTTTVSCAQQAVEIAAQLRAANKVMLDRIDQLEKSIVAFGGGKILGIARVKASNLIIASPGLSWDSGTSIITFPNPENMPFVPIIASSQENNPAGITTIHWIASISGNNTFKVSQHALDTGPRVWPGADFTAVIIGFKSN